MHISTVTSKYQATIPLEIRAMLGINKGDAVGFEIEGGKVVIQKIVKSDLAYLKAIQSTLSEWESEEDNGLI